MYAKHFTTLARIENHKAIALRKSGRMADAFVCFVKRDHFMGRARGTV